MDSIIHFIMFSVMTGLLIVRLFKDAVQLQRPGLCNVQLNGKVSQCLTKHCSMKTLS
jgi:hypothetical protein